jgi:hypothetical protein
MCFIRDGTDQPERFLVLLSETAPKPSIARLDPAEPLGLAPPGGNAPRDWDRRANSKPKLKGR